jgi:hypothetical protein
MQSPSLHPLLHAESSMMADAAYTTTSHTSSSSASSLWLSAPLTPKIQNKRRSISFVTTGNNGSTAVAMPMVSLHDTQNNSDATVSHEYSSHRYLYSDDQAKHSKNHHLNDDDQDDHVTSPTTSSSSSNDSFDCQSLQRSLKRVRLTPMTAVASPSISPMSSPLSIPRTVKSSPGQLRLQRDIQYATSQGFWKPMFSVMPECDNLDHCTTGSTDDTNHKVIQWEVLHQPSSLKRNASNHSNVYITLTHNNSCSLHSGHIDPTTTIELMLQIHLLSTSTSTSRRTRDHNDPISFESKHQLPTNSSTNIVQIIIHIPRLYPHVPPTIYRIDNCNSKTSDTMMMMRSHGIPPSSKILQQYHYPSTQHHHSNHYTTGRNHHNANNNSHPDRWIAGNYYKVNSSAQQECTHDRQHQHQEDNNSYGRTRLYDSSSGSDSDVQNEYRFKYTQPLQDIIVLSNPGDNEEYDTDHPSSTASRSTYTNGILYINKWTPIHRISDIIDWIVDEMIEPIPTGYECHETNTTANVATTMVPPLAPPQIINQYNNNCNTVMIFDEEKDEYAMYRGPYRSTNQQQPQPQNDNNAKASSTMTTQRRNSLPSSTRYDNAYDNNYDTPMDHMNVSTEATNTASDFLNPNRFHVGYKCNDNHDTVNNSNVGCGVDAKTTITTTSISVSKHQPPPPSRSNPAVHGYWNNRSEKTSGYSNDDDDDDDMNKDVTTSPSLAMHDKKCKSSHHDNKIDGDDNDNDDMDISFQ